MDDGEEDFEFGQKPARGGQHLGVIGAWPVIGGFMSQG
jgi:hypothetical protein